MRISPRVGSDLRGRLSSQPLPCPPGLLGPAPRPPCSGAPVAAAANTQPEQQRDRLAGGSGPRPPPPPHPFPFSGPPSVPSALSHPAGGQAPTTPAPSVHTSRGRRPQATRGPGVWETARPSPSACSPGDGTRAQRAAPEAPCGSQQEPLPGLSGARDTRTQDTRVRLWSQACLGTGALLGWNWGPPALSGADPGCGRPLPRACRAQGPSPVPGLTG